VLTTFHNDISFRTVGGSFCFVNVCMRSPGVGPKVGARVVSPVVDARHARGVAIRRKQTANDPLNNMTLD